MTFGPGAGVDPMVLLHNAAGVLLQHAAIRGMGFDRTVIGGLDTAIGRGGNFGTLTRIHPFLFYAVVPPGLAQRGSLQAYSRDAVDYAVRHKGGLPRGMQSGSVAVHVVVTDRMAPGSERWARKPRGSRFAAIGYPVVVSLADRTVTHPKHFVLGAAYARPLRRLVRENVTDVLFPGEGRRR